MAEEKEKGLVVYQGHDGQEIKLSVDIVKRYLVQGHPEFVTEQEAYFFMGTCRARGLDPFKKDCYLVKYTERDTAAIVTSIEHFRARAKSQPDCVGWSCGIIVLDKDEEMIERTGAFIWPGDKLVGGWFRAKPKHWEMEVAWKINLAPFIKKTSQGAVTRFWSEENQPLMICKVAESQGLRRVWPDEFKNFYVEGEILPSEIDVTPLKEPKALERKPANEKKSSLPEQSSEPSEKASSAPVDGMANQSGNGQEPKAPENIRERALAQEPNREEELGPKDKALAWIASLTAENFPLANKLSPFLKNVHPKDQALICARFNARKKELGV